MDTFEKMFRSNLFKLNLLYAVIGLLGSAVGLTNLIFKHSHSPWDYILAVLGVVLLIGSIIGAIKHFPR